MQESVELVVAVYNDEKTAGQVLSALKTLEKEHKARMFNAAILVKDSKGKTYLKETVDIETRRGAVVGAIAGGIVGLLGGPLGALVGAAAGAATGGITASKIDLGFSNDFLDGLKKIVKPRSSVLLVLVDVQGVDQIIKELEEYPGNILRHNVRDELVEQLRSLQDDGMGGETN